MSAQFRDAAGFPLGYSEALTEASMDQLSSLVPLPQLAAAFAVTFFAGFVKGSVGFAMPLIMVSGLTLFLDPLLVIAGIIFPIVVSNGLQVARFGAAEAMSAIREHRRYIIIVCVMILVSAQFLRIIPQQAMYLVLGIPVVGLTIIQIAGFRFRVAPERRVAVEWGVGLVSGTLGGLAGTWGPTTVLYLLALDTPKARQIVVQGVVYGLGAVTLLVAHLQSGILNWSTAPFSALLLVPAALGMFAGFRLSDRIAQDTFRKATLWVLLLAGLNLLRRGIMG
jgi:uncharacterized membrane protein YfcA